MKINKLLLAARHRAEVHLPMEGELPSLGGATAWLNSAPLSAADLRGKVVLIDFWTYTCINWLRTLPYVRAWAEKYREHGVVVIGVHTPEFPFEHDLGDARTENFASPGGAVVDETHVYAAPARFSLNHWALAGEWTVREQAIALNTANGRIAYRFHARDLHLVMGPAARGDSVRFRVLIDGQPPGAAHGIDVDDQGNGTAAEQRLYQLIRQPKPIADRLFEIEFLDSGVETFAFTFG